MFSPKSTNEWRYSIIGLTADNKLGNKSMLAPVKNVRHCWYQLTSIYAKPDFIYWPI